MSEGCFILDSSFLVLHIDPFLIYQTVYFAERQLVLGQDWHKTCVKCDRCGKKLEPGNFSDNSGKIYCKACYNVSTGISGYGYGGAGGTLASFSSYGKGESELIGGDKTVEPDFQGGMKKS